MAKLLTCVCQCWVWCTERLNLAYFEPGADLAGTHAPTPTPCPRWWRMFRQLFATSSPASDSAHPARPRPFRHLRFYLKTKKKATVDPAAFVTLDNLRTICGQVNAWADRPPAHLVSFRWTAVPSGSARPWRSLDHSCSCTHTRIADGLHSDPLLSGLEGVARSAQPAPFPLEDS